MLNFRSADNKRFFFLCLACSEILALFVRLPYFLNSDFPINDGGLFVKMIDALKANHYLVPAFVEYSGEKIPFAYPPLGFYVAGFFCDLLGVETITMVRILPLVLNLGCVFIFVMVAFSYLNDKPAVLFASIIFPLLPEPYGWLIMGGGVTRSLGFLFFLLTILGVKNIDLGSTWKQIAGVALFASAAVLSHMEYGIFACTALVVIVLIQMPNRHGLRFLLTFGFLVLVFTSPWWGSVIARHDLQPYLSAGEVTKTGEQIIVREILNLHCFTLSYSNLLRWLNSIGIIVCLYRREWVLPGLSFSLFLTAARWGAGGAACAAPYALFSAIGTSTVSTFLLRVAKDIFPKKSFGLKESHVVPIFGIGMALFLFFRTRYADIQKDFPLESLTLAERNAMAWIKTNTQPDDSFILISDTSIWGRDRYAEWFPVLADRENLTTGQGFEWLPDRKFEKRLREIASVKWFLKSKPFGLPYYIRSYYKDRFTHIAVFVPNTRLNFAGFLESGHYRVVHKDSALCLLKRIN